MFGYAETDIVPWEQSRLYVLAYPLYDSLCRVYNTYSQPNSINDIA